MKQASKKLGLRRETIHHLTRKDLVHVAGGAAESDDRQCPTWIAKDPADATRGR
jgi:hypothetical protein